MKKFLKLFSKYFHNIVTAVIVLVVAGVIGLFAFYFHFTHDLPKLSSFADYRPPLMSEVFADDGSKIGEYWSECRKFLSLEDIPLRLRQAFIASEDERFYEHQGIDMRAIARAFVANLNSRGIAQGGSTITQQVTRALLLSNERTYKRKIKEVILSLRLERNFSKDQILTIYLNQIFLGNRSYGVAAAARNYFHQETKDLTLGQIALLAGLPTAPATYSPLINAKAARIRQERVLKRMYEEDYISLEEMKAAAEEQFPIYMAGVDKTFVEPANAHFVEHIRRYVKEKYGDKVLYEGGLKIESTSNVAMQQAAFAATQKGVIALDKRQGWRGPLAHVEMEVMEQKAQELKEQYVKQYTHGTVQWPTEFAHTDSMEPKMGELYNALVTSVAPSEVIVSLGLHEGKITHEGFKWARHFNTAWDGYDGANYVDNATKLLQVGDLIKVRKREDGSFDLAQAPEVQTALFSIDSNNGAVRAMIGGNGFGDGEFNRSTQAMRQPGSSFKPFVYAAALDKGYTFDTKIVDEPVTYEVGAKELWAPKNYDGKFEGPTDLRHAIMFSRNVPTVKIAYDIGTHYLTAYVRKLGLTTPINPFLSMALGANDLYLNELVQAYTAFANQGRRQSAVYITKITDRDGKVLESFDPTKENTTPQNLDAIVFPDTEAGKTMKNVVAGLNVEDLNKNLFLSQLPIILKDGLVLNELEIKTLYGKQIPEGSVITPQTAFLMTNLLRSAVEGGTGTAVKALKRPAAGKTGTTNEDSDAWFVGFIPDMVAGAWMGFDAKKPIGKRETGGITVAPIFLNFMKEAVANWPVKDFTAPEGFPKAEMASLSGGSALFGNVPKLNLQESYASDRAGSFFEQDLMDYQEDGGSTENWGY